MPSRLIFSKTVIMITSISRVFNTDTKYTQDSYDSDIRYLNYATVKCPECGAVGFFHNHGRYPRYLFNNSDELIRVQRVRCEKCLSTHALLPDVIVPYRYFSSPFLMNLFTLYLIKAVSIVDISRCLDISIPAIMKLIKYYRQSHQQRTMIINPEYSNPLDHSFLISYFRAFFLSFMQHQRHCIRHLFYEGPIT